MSYIPSNHPSQPEPSIPAYPPASSLPDDTYDRALDLPCPEGLSASLTQAGARESGVEESGARESGVNESVDTQDETDSQSRGFALPSVILGGGQFGYGIYDDEAGVSSDMPVRVIRMALRCGMNAFDTSPHYHPSEIIIGHALRCLAHEFPRSSYTLITKAGKYGSAPRDHVYTPETIVESVQRSLRRLGTEYLDVVYLHDVEFVATAPYPSPAGHHLSALDPSSPLSAAFHLDASTHTPQGRGDEVVLSALGALRSLQAAGKIRKVGIAGYPLPLLLRLSLMVLHTTGAPLDIVQSYAHQTIQNAALGEGYLDALVTQAHVGQVVNAAPLAMGILTTRGGPAWHPVVAGHARLEGVCKAAAELCRAKGTSIEAVSTDFGFRALRQPDAGGTRVPVVIGCKNLAEMERTLKSWWAVNPREGADAAQRRGQERGEVENEVIALFESEGVRNWSWQSPSKESIEA